MDKNKAASKLKGLPHVYCINLDGEPHRWESMEKMLKYWEVENYTRISAYDGREAVSYTHLTLPTIYSV